VPSILQAGWPQPRDSEKRLEVLRSLRFNANSF
jgi:hypothetical protein